MPIFKKNFVKKPLKATARESRLVEDVDDFKNISLKLSDKNTLKFVNGVWMVLKKNQATDFDDAVELVKTNQKLEEEKTMLTAKMDILLDLLSETISEKAKK